MKLQFHSEKRDIRNACIMCEKHLRLLEIPENVCQEVVLAIDEALTNILEHGYGKPGPDKGDMTATGGGIELDIEFFDQNIRINISDNAAPYSLQEKSIDDKQAYLASGTVGGFGIRIIKQVMDKVELARTGDRNLLSMSRRVVIPPRDGSVFFTTDTSVARVIDRVLYVKTLPGAVIDTPEARRNVWAYQDMANKYPQKMVYAKIVDQTEMKNLTMAARSYYAKEEAGHIKAIALINRPKLKCCVFNLMGFLFRKHRAIRFFTNLQDAQKWVQKFSDRVK